MINIVIILIVAVFATSVVLYLLSIDRPPSESHKKRFTNKHGLIYKLEDVILTSFAHLYYWDSERNTWIPVYKVSYGDNKTSKLCDYEPELGNYSVDYEDMNDSIADQFTSIEDLKSHNKMIKKSVERYHEEWLKTKNEDNERIKRYKM